MRRITDSKTRSVIAHTEDQGDVQQEQVAEVTFIDHAGSIHTLVFEPPGTVVSGDNEPEQRTVGENVPHYAFASPEEAVDAYENGVLV